MTASPDRRDRGRLLVPALLLLVAAGMTVARERGPAPPGNPGQAIAPAADGVHPPAPGFTLPAVSGQDAVRLDDYRGRVVLLNFFATWCAPCRQEAPALERVSRQLAPRGFVVLGISLDEGDDAAARVRRFASEEGLTFPLALGNGELAARYGADRLTGMPLPTSFLIDRRGRLRRVWTGPVSEQALVPVAEALLAD